MIQVVDELMIKFLGVFSDGLGTIPPVQSSALSITPAQRNIKNLKQCSTTHLPYDINAYALSLMSIAIQDISSPLYLQASTSY